MAARFPTTRWSRIMRAGDTGDDSDYRQARSTFESRCRRVGRLIALRPRTQVATDALEHDNQEWRDQVRLTIRRS